jgi:hypothetical protein
MTDWELFDPITRENKIRELMQRYASGQTLISDETLALTTYRLTGRWKPAANVRRSGDAKRIDDIHIAIKKLRRALPFPPSVHTDVMRQLDEVRGERISNKVRYTDPNGEVVEGFENIPRLMNLAADLEALEKITHDPEELLAKKVRTQKNAQALQAVHAGAYAYYKTTNKKPVTQTLTGEFERFLGEFFDIVFSESHDPKHAYKGWGEIGGQECFDKITVKPE